MLGEKDWQAFDVSGFMRLGQVLDAEQVEALKQRADDLALGAVRNPAVQLQRDTGGVYEELPQAQAQDDGATLRYRKVQGLEADELFRPLVQHPLFREVCARLYGPHAGVSLFRAMIMNKPAEQGTVLPWHQDGGDVWALDRDPLVTIWVALDPATVANGCVEVIPGSHRLGLLRTYGSTVLPDDVARHCPESQALPLEVEPGYALLLHNWLIHRSGVNPSTTSRRAFTACYMDARTQSTLTGDGFPLVFGQAPPVHPHLRQLRDDCAILRASIAEATAYAQGLEAQLRRSDGWLAPLRWLSRRLGRG